MTQKVFALDTRPGVQRDGTYFDKDFYTDGRWVRFQRGRPRKILGYRAISNSITGLSRGIYVNSEDGYNLVFNGYESGLESLEMDNNGIGAGITEITFGGPILTLGAITGGTGYTPGSYTGVALTGGSGSGAKADITVDMMGVVTAVTITNGGQYYKVGDSLSSNAIGAGSNFDVAVATVDSNFTANENNLWQFDAIFDTQGVSATLLLAHPGQNLAQIDSTVSTPVLACPVNSDVTTPLQDINGSNPTGDTISVSGGVVVLHPYVFVYGDNGLIKNSSAGDPFNWNGADANEVNVASTKVVKGLPVRGGSNAPSGLFWALDSLIRVSYAPTSIGVAGTGNYGPTLYWRYDIISSQSSILSSSSVIEYDGIYYWIGVDRFLLYNGVVKEIPNNMNQNYFFDNLNYNQRQKVWATKVPRYGEIWWFYPSGNSEECNDCIIYNVRENTWYDGGQALGSRRSAGYFSQVFAYPVNAGTNLSVEEPILTSQISTMMGSADVEIEISNQLRVGLVVSSPSIPAETVVLAIAPSVNEGYLILTLSNVATDTQSEDATFLTPAGLSTLWQHETGTDMVNGEVFEAIESYIETSDLGWVGGGPAQTGLDGINKWLRLERVEPDFVQSGDMELYIVGRPYAQADDQISSPYVFSPGTHKIDMREQRRELRLKFRSNVAGGNYQMGRVLLNADFGDVRGY